MRFPSSILKLSGYPDALDYLIFLENINLTFPNKTKKVETTICKWLLGFVECPWKTRTRSI